MYEVTLINNNISTIVHYPTADISAPHLNNLPFKESLSLPDRLDFSIFPNNPGYDLIEGLITKVKVRNTKDDSILFSGRVMSTKHQMSSSGLFYKDVECEGGLAYLNDTQTRRWKLTNQTPTQILTYLLAEHNAKVDASRRIQLGTIDVNQPLTIDTNYETTLNTIISKLRNILGGDLRARETAGVLYLDYLVSQGANNGVGIELGYNMRDIVEEYDPLDIVSRVIPLGYGEGINQLDIKKVNGNIEHLDNAASISKYGIIEGIAINKDIQDGATLKIYASTVLAEKSQARLTININSLDLSVLVGHENEKFNNGDSLGIINTVMGIDVIARVIERDMDLLEPYNPRLSISTRPSRFSDQITELRQRNMTLENAPQGSTYIDTFGYAENIDALHNFQLPIWLSPDILNVNRVRLHVDSQKYRAYEKGIASGGSSTTTSTSGGSSTPTSASGGGSTEASASSTQAGVEVSNNGVTSDASVGTSHDHNFIYYSFALATFNSHTHNVTIPAHTHSVSVPAHTHDVAIPTHQHAIDYGIFEDTYPGGVTIKINGVVIPDVVLEDGGVLNLDITSYISTPGTTYNLEVTSNRNGRVNVWVSIQAFIQTK